VTGQTIEFDASGSAGAIVKYDWSLDGSGSFGTSCGGSSAKAHSGYSDPGTYPITLRVTDAAGVTSTVAHDVAIADGGAIAAIAGASCGGAESAMLAPGLRGPPAIAITAPGDFAYYDRAPGEVLVSGTLKAPEGISQFCVTGGSSVPDTIPAGCNHKAYLLHGKFTDVPVSGFKPGFNWIDAWVKDSVGTVKSAEIVITVANAATGLDLRADGMEVTQGIQRTTIPETNPQKYSGVGLARDGKTIVRLYADAPRIAKFSPGLFVKNVDAALWGFRGGKALPEGPLLAEEGARTLKTGTGYSGEFDLATARGDATGAYTFTLPPSWTHGTLKLVGVVNTPDLPPALAECTSCYGNNQFEIDDVKFTPTHGFKIVSANQTRIPGGLVPSPEGREDRQGAPV
jgi:hypothetical protein